MQFEKLIANVAPFMVHENETIRRSAFSIQKTLIKLNK